MMRSELERINTDMEGEVAAAEFHFMFLSRVVAPWGKLLSSLGHMDGVNARLTEAIGCWEERKKPSRASAVFAILF
jgi:hypothetical protein